MTSTPPRPRLTPTQWLILERLAGGEGNAAIGLALGIARGTVATHLNVMYQRLPPMLTCGKRLAAAMWYLTVGGALREQEVSGDG